MIKFEAFASGSKGNLYTVTDGITKIMIECGVAFKDVKKALNYKVSDIAGCLISHEHSDHAKGIKDLMKFGIDCYASQGTFEALKVAGHRMHPIKSLEQFQIGTWSVLPFDTNHDCAEPLGFLIANGLGEKLLFITDSFYVKYKFKDISIIAVEANYSMEILNKNIRNGSIPPVMKKRLMRSHFSLENVKDFLKANDLSKLQEIWLLHLSDSNSNAELFKREVQELTGKLVIVP